MLRAQSPGQGAVGWSQGWRLFRRFWPFLRPERRRVAVVAALLVLAIPAGVVAPLLIKRLFDEALPRRDLDLLLRLGVIILGITVLAHALRFAAGLLVTGTQKRVRHRVTVRLYEHVLRLPLRYLHGQETGYVMARIRDDVASLHGVMLDNLVHGLVDLARGVLFFGLLLATDLALALYGLLLLAVIFTGVVLTSKPLRRRSEAAQETDAAFSGALHQALTGIATIRTSAQEPGELRRLSRFLKAAVRAAMRRDVLHLWVSYAVGLAVAVGMYLILILGAWLILRRESTFGSLMAFSIYLTYVAGAVTAVLSLNPEVQRALASLQRIFRLLDEPAESTRGRRRGRLHVHGRVAFERVSFRYGEVPALHDVSLVVEPGEVLAIVGRSGAGKSTLVSLIPRLHDPTSGRVLLDGVPLVELPLTSLRERIGVVPQDVFLFNRTIRENIAFGRPGATDAEVHAAAATAHAAEFIERLEAGYDTLVGERGVKLSGGEKQRIAIAREVLRDPAILILDEATSSLDSESETLIQDAFERVKRDRTCFVIAHRLSTVMNADRIVVLDEGRIAEIGSHAELLERDGLYRRLYDLQFA